MKKTYPLVLVNISVLLFGAAGLFARWVSLPAVLIAFGRVSVSALSLFIYSLATKQPIRIKDKAITILLSVAGIVLAVHWSMFFLSIELSTVAIGTITFSTFPLFVTFLEPLFFKEKLKARNIAMSILIIAGVIVTIPSFSVVDRAFLGIAAGMLSSLSYAALAMLNRYFAKSFTSTFIALYEQSFAAIALIPSLFIVKGHPTSQDIALLVLLGVVMTALAHTLFISTLKDLTAQTAGITSSLEAVYGIALAFLFLGESPSTRELIGCVLIVGTVMLSNLAGAKNSRELQDEA
ncbi:MAG: DMT family transporter [Eubacteriaceae bacterium]|nr:DMT family transporter [Eubacteriaceae bacterium]